MIRIEKINQIYKICMYEVSGYYWIHVKKMRPVPKGNYGNNGIYRGPNIPVDSGHTYSLVEAWCLYFKLRQTWRHCYS